MPTEIKITRKEGWDLNPNDRIVNSVLYRIAQNNGFCPCTTNPDEGLNRKCPCLSYLEEDCCHCNLYVKKD